MESGSGQSSQTNPIVCGVDDAPNANEVAEFAANLASRLGTTLLLVNVIPEPWVSERPAATYNDRQREAEAFERAGQTHLMLSQIKVAGERGIGLAVEFGPTAKVLSAAAADLGASLLVVGDQERTGIDRTVVGSTTVEVIRKAPCPVVVFPSKPAPTRAGPLVCGVDQSKSALAATRVAARMARQLELKLVLVTAVEGSRDAEDTFDRELQAAGDHLPEDSIELIAQPGAPVDVLPQVGRELEAEMIFVGSRGLGVIRRALLGSVSTALLQEADDRPVVVVPDGTDEEGGGG